MLKLIIETAVAVIVAVLLRTFVFMPVVVKGSSMKDTLENGDRLLATHVRRFSNQLERGRIVICHYPGSHRKNYVKRLIALPGDTIEIHEGVTYINGSEYAEKYVAHPTQRNFGPITLCDDEYFVMGDNRRNSRDSRTVGTLKRRQIVAVVRLRLCSRSHNHRAQLY